MLRALLTAALIAPVLAQDPAPLLLRVDSRGPATWRARLLPTNLGSMFASAAGEALWRPITDRVDALLREAHPGGDAFARSRARLLDYSGAVRLGVRLERAPVAGDPASWTAVLIAEGDGHTDLAALARDLEHWFYSLTEEAPEGGAATVQLGSVTVLLPRLQDGAVMAGAVPTEDAPTGIDDLAARIAAAQSATAAAAATDPDPTLPLLALELDLPALLALSLPRPTARRNVAAWFGDTRSLHFTLAPRGPRLQGELSLAFGDGDRALPGALWPDEPGVPALSWLAPQDAVAFHQGRWGPAALLDTFENALAIAHDLTAAEVRERFTEGLGMDVRKRLLAHLSTDYLVVWLQQPGGGRRDHSLLGNACLVGRLRDEAAFREGFENWLATAYPSATLSTEPGVLRAHKHGALFDPAVHLAIADGLACLAFGPHARQNVDAVLLRALEATPSAGAAGVPEAPPGVNGAGSVSVTTLFSRQLPSMLMLLRSLTRGALPLPRPTELFEQVEPWLPLLERHELARASVLTGTAGQRFRLRVLW